MLFDDWIVDDAPITLSDEKRNGSKNGISCTKRNSGSYSKIKE